VDHQHANTPFASILTFVGFVGSRCKGPPGEVGKPSKGVMGLFLVIVVIRDLGGDCVVLARGSEGVVTLLVKTVLIHGLCDRASRTLDRVREDIKGMAVGRAFVK